MLVALIAFAWFTAWAAPETATGAALHRWTVAAPARWLGQITRGQVTVAVGTALLLIAASWLGHDANAIVAGGSPELIGLLGSVELSGWIDALAGALLTWTAARASGPARRVLPRRPQPRARRARRTTARKPPVNDDHRPVPLAA